MNSRIINFKTLLASLLAQFLPAIASGYAMTLCTLKMYEPEVPEELLK